MKKRPINLFVRWIMCIRLTFDLWNIKTIFKSYNNQEKWLNANMPLNLSTAWQVAKSIYYPEIENKGG